MRGQDEIRKFGKIMLSTLNLEKNTNKGDWSRMTWMEMMIHLKLEVDELYEECQKCAIVSDYDSTRVASEASDVALYAMFLADKFRCLKS